MVKAKVIALSLLVLASCSHGPEMTWKRVAMDGSPAEVFSHAGRLLEIGLNVPRASELALALRKKGVAVPEDVFTHERLLASLLALREGRPC